ncbi:SLC13 family permease [Clostridium estertheticum]|uniref:SLC13 family permease n=1 Tax=Clostridium estertheticum TaxID=238834 RepID=UPI001C7C9FCC|nr:SLC13 family permease [Clostridium estertheticum]MBX4270055.1 SLC13 family permease [Clostridium estertheticum]WLC80259.1 SLC13 family permease [Clostridium estertheticum]
MTSLIIVLAIAITITLGYKTRVNPGFFAMCFAYIIGCFILNLKATEIIGMWSLSMFFVIFSVSLFYNFALVNGTLENISQHLLYSCRKAPNLLPLVIYFAAVLIGGLGAGFFTVLVLLAPITLILCEKTGMSRIVGAISLNYGALAGGNFMTSSSGVVFKSLIETAGFKESGFVYITYIFIVTFIIPIFVISFLTMFSKNLSKVGKNLEIEKPKAFDKKQKTNLYLIVLMLAVILIPPVLHLIIPENAAITFINSKIDVGLVSIVFTVVALMLNLGDEKKVIATVPWSTIIMICGVGMLIQVAMKAGTIALLANWIGGNIPGFAMPIALCVVAGIMALFSSPMGVVTPALFPIVPSISAATGINPAILFICIIIGAQASTLSPFSSGGSLILGSCTKEDERAELFPKLLFFGVPLCLGVSIVVSIIISLVIK